MAVFRWSAAGRSWQPVEGDPPVVRGGAQVSLYETLLTSVSAYALALHADRLARSWELLTGRPLSVAPVPPLDEGRAEARRQSWPALRFDVQQFPDGSVAAEIRRRERLAAMPPVPLLLVEYGASEAAYPHKSADRTHLARAYERALAAGAFDALLVVGGEAREAAAAFVGLVTSEALVVPPLRQHVLPSTTRTAAADWCRTRGRAVLERPIRMDELGNGALIYGNALLGLVPAFAAGRPAVPLPGWFDAPAIERELAE